MKKINEDLNLVANEPESSETAIQAKQLGLVYVGFGRYEDPATGQVAYIVQNDQLVPYKKAVNTNTYQQNSSNDINNFAQELSTDEQETHNTLLQKYSTLKYSDDQLDAIRYYTGEGYSEVNDRLLELPTGLPADEIQPESSSDYLPQIIKTLDKTLLKTKTKFDFTVYSVLSPDIDISQLKPKTEFVFKGYRSTTISLQNAIVDQVDQKTIVMLQILIPSGSYGMYVDDYSETAGQNEFLLPRASQIKIVSGPTKLVGSSNDNRQTIFYFNCELLV